MTWIWWVLPAAGGLLCLALYPRHGLAGVLKSWELLLTPAMKRALAALTSQMELDAARLDLAHQEATQARQSTQMDEAVRLLDLAFGGIGFLLEESTPVSELFSARLHVPPFHDVDLRFRRVYTRPQEAGILRVGASIAN